MESFHDFRTAHPEHELGGHALPRIQADRQVGLIWRMGGCHDSIKLRSGRRSNRFLALAAVWTLSAGLNAAAQSATNSVALAPTLPNVGVSLVRVLGALAIVVAVFLGGVWLVRNWQRLVLQRGRQQSLNVLEVRSLGGRHALYVVGYEQERFLVAASPTGVNLVSHLQPSEEDAPATAPRSLPQPSFAQALTQMLKGK